MWVILPGTQSESLLALADLQEMPKVSLHLATGAAPFDTKRYQAMYCGSVHALEKSYITVCRYFRLVSP